MRLQDYDATAEDVCCRWVSSEEGEGHILNIPKSCRFFGIVVRGTISSKRSGAVEGPVLVFLFGSFVPT